MDANPIPAASRGHIDEHTHPPPVIPHAGTSAILTTHRICTPGGTAMTIASPPPVQTGLRGSQQPFWFLGGRVRLLVPGAATTGAVSVLEFSDTQGQAPPLHVHDREDEIWSVFAGSITFVVGDDVFDLGPGEVALGPRGIPHSYVVRSATAQMLVTYAPSGVEEWFVTNGSPLEQDDDAPAPFDVAAIVSAGLRYGVHVVGPPPT